MLCCIAERAHMQALQEYPDYQPKGQMDASAAICRGPVRGLLQPQEKGGQAAQAQLSCKYIDELKFSNLGPSTGPSHYVQGQLALQLRSRCLNPSVIEAETDDTTQTQYTSQ